MTQNPEDVKQEKRHNELHNFLKNYMEQKLPKSTETAQRDMEAIMSCVKGWCV